MILQNRVGLVVGVANAQSIAAGCAAALLPLDLADPDQLEAVFAAIDSRWGRLDFLLHSVAFCPKDDLHGRVMDCSAAGFAQAMDISCHSLLRMVRRAEPLMQAGGSLLTVSYYGAEKVVDHYNIMGPVKAALEAVTRKGAVELGPQAIRVNVLSPGPIATRAALGIEDFEDLMAEARSRASERRLVTIDGVGDVAAFLVSDKASGVTGTITHIDGDRHVRS